MFLLLYDGVCGLCNRANRFVIAHDREDRFRFAPLQSDLARKVLARHGQNAEDLDTFFVVLDYDQASERILSRGRGAVFVLSHLPPYRALAKTFAKLPDFALDAAYRRIATNRYRIFGKSDSCPVPSPEHRAKFIAAEEG